MITKIQLKDGIFERIQDCYFYKGKPVNFAEMMGALSLEMGQFLCFGQIPLDGLEWLKFHLEKFLGQKK